MPIVFTPHAKFQLRKRHISQKMIAETIINPDETIISYKNRRLRRRQVGGKILQAITVTEGSRITVIACYYLRRKNENKL